MRAFTFHIFLACNHVTRRPCWWCIGGQYNRFFFRRMDMKIEFNLQRREMLLFLTLTHHQHGRRHVKCKPAIKMPRFAHRVFKTRQFVCAIFDTGRLNRNVNKRLHRKKITVKRNYDCRQMFLRRNAG